MKLRQKFKRAVTLLTVAAIVFSLVFYSGSSVILRADEQKDLENRLEEIEKEREQTNKKIKDTQNDISKEKEYQEAIEKQIEDTEEYIRTLNDLIAEYNDGIEALEGDIASLEDEIAWLEGDIEIQRILISNKRAEIDENIVLYEQRLRAMYLSGNDSVASIILGATDFFDMLMKIELVKRVADYNNDLIKKLLSMKAEYEAAQLELENQHVELENRIAAIEETKEIAEGKRNDVVQLKEKWDSELSDLESLYKKSKKAIKELEEKEAAYKANQKELEKEAEETEKKIKKLIEEKSRAEYMGDQPLGTFIWPLPGYYTVTDHYGARWGTTHKGMDIAGSGCAGAKITAANSGVVIAVYNSCTHNYYKTKSCGCGGGFGNYCIVDHGGGYTTLYAHAEKMIVKEGQAVTTGDTLGYVGQTGFAMGYHLHFEVRVNGERRDPESFNLIKK